MTRRSWSVAGARWLCACCCLTAVACSADADEDPVAPASGPLRVDGLLLLHDQDHRLLFDPASERLGPQMQGAFSIAPDLTRLVRRQDAATVVVETVGRAADGTPTLTTTASLQVAGATGPNVLGATAPAFNAQGDRVSGAGWWDPSTGAHLPLGGASASPDGRHHVGLVDATSGALLLYEDLQPVMPVEESLFTSDGQWLVATDGVLGETFRLSHVPSRTKVLRPDADRPERGFSLPVDPLTQFRLPYTGSDVRGRLAFYADGRRGLLPPALPCGLPEALVGPIAPVTQYFPARLADGDLAGIETPLDALDRLPHETDASGRAYDGFEWSVLGITPDGRAAIVQHRWYFVDSNETAGCPVWFISPRTLDLFRVELGGDGALQPQLRVRETGGAEASEAIAFGCATAEVGSPVDPTEPLAFRLRRRAGLQFLSESDWLCGTEDATFAAFVAGEGRVAPMPGSWPSLDRASLLGPAPTEAAARYGDARVTTGLCQGPLTGGITSCVVPPALRTARHVVAQVGVDLVPRASTGPVVTALSQRAATVGTAVRVLGYGFGSAGTLRIGAVTVDAGSIRAWSDKAIDFTMPGDAPEVGLVGVTDVSGAASTQRQVWLGRSEAWAGVAPVPSGPFELRQGVNRIMFPGAGAFVVGIRSLSQIQPGGDLPSVPEGVGPDHVDALVPKSPRDDIVYPWMTFRTARGLVFRPLTITPGLVDDTRWQPIGDEIAVGAFSRFVTSLGIMHVSQPREASGAITAGGPALDWVVSGFSPSEWGGFRDGEEVWQRSGPILERLTGWTLQEGGARTPVFTPEITTPFTAPIPGFGVHDALVVVMLEEVINGQAYGSLQVSTDRGARFTELLPLSRGLWTTWSGFVDGPRPGLYGRLAGFDDAGVMIDQVARVTPEGVLEVSATVSSTPGGEVPCSGGFVPFGSALLCHDQPRGRLYAVDVSVAEGEAWEELGGALAGHISSVFVSTAGIELLVGTDSGGLWQSEDLVSWSQRDQVTLGPVELPLTVHAVGAMEDGATIALVQHESWGNARFVVRATPP